MLRCFQSEKTHYWVSRSREQSNDGIPTKKRRGKPGLELERLSEGRAASPGTQGRVLPAACDSAARCRAGRASWGHPLIFCYRFPVGGLVPQTAFPKGYTVSYIDVWAVLGEKLTMRTTLPTQESLSHICNLVEKVEITHLTAPGVTAEAFWEM